MGNDATALPRDLPLCILAVRESYPRHRDEATAPFAAGIVHGLAARRRALNAVLPAPSARGAHTPAAAGRRVIGRSRLADPQRPFGRSERRLPECLSA